MSNLLKYRLKDINAKIHTLTYFLYDTPLTTKWINIVKENQKNSDVKVYSFFNSPTPDSLPEFVTKIKDLVTKINNEYKDQLPVYDTFGKDELNHLHALFERWGPYKNESSQSLQKYMFLLNESIHQCEEVLEAVEYDSYLRMHTTVDLHPLGIHKAIEEEDKLLLTSEFRWGGLYLGYNTLGKDYLTIMNSNDTRVIELDEVKPQRRFAAENWLYFGEDFGPIVHAQVFANWIKNLPKETQKKIPVNDLNKLNFGRFLLGQLMFGYDETMKKIDPNITHWRDKDHICRPTWNKEVFSTFKEVVDMEIVKWPPEELDSFNITNRKKQWKPDKNNPPENIFENDCDWSWAPVTIDNFNERRAREELERVDKYFVDHRAKDKISGYGHDGWQSLTLHGIAPDKTENYDRYGYKSEEEANYHWTDVCKHCPYIVDIIKSLPYKQFSRVRLMKLGPLGYIMPHTDAPDGKPGKRIFGALNIALTQPRGCEFVIEGAGVIPFKPGRGFCLDIGNRHAVTNGSDQNRYHIIIHGMFTEEIGPLMKKSLDIL